MLLSTLLWLKQAGVNERYIQQSESDQQLAFQRALTVELTLAGACVVAGCVLVPVAALVLGQHAIIVPGLILLTWWSMIVPVIVLERRSAGESDTSQERAAADDPGPLGPKIIRVRLSARVLSGGLRRGVLRTRHLATAWGVPQGHRARSAVQRRASARRNFPIAWLRNVSDNHFAPACFNIFTMSGRPLPCLRMERCPSVALGSAPCCNSKSRIPFGSKRASFCLRISVAS